jgi:hypothetical protein
MWRRLDEASGQGAQRCLEKLHSSVTDDATAKALLDEQRAWNDYKEKSCLFYASGYFGREGTGANLSNLPGRSDRGQNRRPQLLFRGHAAAIATGACLPPVNAATRFPGAA